MQAWHDTVGKKVVKVSGKPFKSGLKVGTAQCVAVHDHTTHLAYRMLEDGSSVECFRTRLATEADLADTTRSRRGTWARLEREATELKVSW